MLVAMIPTSVAETVFRIAGARYIQRPLHLLFVLVAGILRFGVQGLSRLGSRSCYGRGDESGPGQAEAADPHDRFTR
jgi:hypothetical protein